MLRSMDRYNILTFRAAHPEPASLEEAILVLLALRSVRRGTLFDLLQALVMDGAAFLERDLEVVLRDLRRAGLVGLRLGRWQATKEGRAQLARRFPARTANELGRSR